MSILEGPTVFVDIETTGLSYYRSRIIEIAVIRLENNRIIKVLNTLVDPRAELPMFISDLTGIKGSDLANAPTFYDISKELQEILSDALFVAHNVRFDYSFLKHEFASIGVKFNPKLLCTVKLSKSLYPDARGHRLDDLAKRCDLKTSRQHRAYDDAHVVMQFVQHVSSTHPAPSLELAIREQLKMQSLPKNLLPDPIRDLPEQTGVYIFKDHNGSPLYIGKSVNIKKRVLDHFRSDHSFESEFKIAQQIADIETITTGGELQALLLESNLIKSMQPVYNRKLRRNQKLTLARQTLDDKGYIKIDIEDIPTIDPNKLDNILAVYTTKGKAKEFLNQAARDFSLCPKLMGLEKGSGACFLSQLKKCHGACAGKESAQQYNTRLLSVFDGRRMEEWPYNSPIIIEEEEGDTTHSIVVDQWCVVANIEKQEFCEPQINFQEKMFDIDTYKILRSYLASKMHKVKVKPISLGQLHALSVA